MWSCLTCSKISCGRKQFDGRGGNGHALAHWESELHPIAIRLGTLTSNSFEIYCYSCDDMTTADEKLSSSLSATLNSTAVSHVKREQSLLELEQLRPNIIEEGLVNQNDLIPDTNSIGIKNLGNSCYISVILQMLFHSSNFPLDLSHFYVCFKNPISCFECQTIKIANFISNSSNLTSEFISEISPISFRRLLMKELPSLAGTSTQQDAAEFFQAFFLNISTKMSTFKYLKNNYFPLSTRTAIECTECDYQNTQIISDDYSPLIVLPKENSSISNAILKFFKKGPSESVFCSKCNLSSVITYSYLATSALPQFLLVQLYIFDTDENKQLVKVPLDLSSFTIDFEFSSNILTLQPNKCNLSVENIPNFNELLGFGFSEHQIRTAIDKVDNPKDINLVIDWICSNPVDRENTFTDQKEDSTTITQPNSMYKLSAIICHRGKSVHCGHYYALIKEPSGQWLLFDDEKVSKIDNYMPYFPSAYLLLYSIIK